MRDLSVIIPARNEIFLQRTIEDVLKNKCADTEVIAILDGYWPQPPVKDHPDVIVIHHTKSIGQRAATNEGARISQAKYVMKLDAHCALDKGFDAKLIDGAEYDWTQVPVMYNLHAFDWKCDNCGNRTYQGVRPQKCTVCKDGINFDMVLIWEPNRRRATYSWRFDDKLRFQYWHKHRNRPETRRGEYVETMSFIGACFFMDRKRYWELDGLDEQHGSWGQVGTEIACKSWLSGGKLLTNKKTWFSHMFRTGNFATNGCSPWPYEITNEQIEKARAYSLDFWTNNKWAKAVYPLEWLVDKFKPIPDWHQ